MKTGHLRITNAGAVPKIDIRLVNGTVWLTKAQIADLFGIFHQTIESTLKTGFRSGALVEDDVCHIHRYTNLKHQERQTIFYNLEALIFISYHTHSANIAIFRRWVTQALGEHLRKKDKMEAIELSYLFRDGHNFS